MIAVDPRRMALSSRQDDQGRAQRVEAIQIMARGVCRGTKDQGADPPQPADCWCRGDIQRCHAETLYRNEMILALLALERAGFVVLRLPSSDETAALIERELAPTVAPLVAAEVAALNALADVVEQVPAHVLAAAARDSGELVEDLDKATDPEFAVPAAKRIESFHQ
jgi:hypothetical protein